MAGSQGDLPLRIICGRYLPAGSCGTTIVVRRDLGLNTPSIWSCAYLGQNGPDRLDQAVLLARSGILEGSLNDIVGERVS